MAKNLLLFLGLGLVIWWLCPPRSLKPESTDPAVVEITFMQPGGLLSGAMEDVVRAFERESEARHAADERQPIYRVVSGQNAAQDQVADPTRFLVSVAGGAPPDVILFDRFAIAEWAARGAFTPLDDYIERDKVAGKDTPERGKFYATAWEEGMYGGKAYGIPETINSRALFYNADLLIRAGLTDEQGKAKPPRTWEELREYTKKLTEFDERGRLKTAGFMPNFGNSWLYLFGWMNGGEFLSADGTRVTLNDPRVVEALAYMKELYDLGGGFAALEAYRTGFQGGAQNPFITGQVAMKIDGVWSLGEQYRFGRDMNFGIAPPPRPARLLDGGGKAVSWVGGFAYAIPATAKKKDAAWEFVRFLTSRRAAEILSKAEQTRAAAEGRMYIPEQHPQPEINQWLWQTHIYDNPAVNERFKHAGRVFNELLPDSRYRPITPVGQLLWNQQVTAMQRGLYGSATPQEALDDATATVQRSLDRFVQPRGGMEIRSWTWFFVLYGLMVAGAGVVIYLREVHKKPVSLITRGQWLGGFVCCGPWILGFLIFGGGPMLFSFIISFTEYDILSAPRFVGVNNYLWMWNGDELFLKSLFNTLYMAMGVPLGMAVGLAIALLLVQPVRAVAMWRTLFYVPAIVPVVASSVLWFWVLNPQGGMINGMLRLVGIEGPLWLADSDWSKPSLLLMGLWGAGGGMVIWIAGLKAIPASLYEAAEVDGAGVWRQFVSITLPQLSPYIFFNLIMGLIGTFQMFQQAFVMTQGGPVNSTLFYVYHLWNHAFRFGQMGYASSLAWVLVVIVMALTLWQLRLSKRWVHYETD